MWRICGVSKAEQQFYDVIDDDYVCVICVSSYFNKVLCYSMIVIFTIVFIDSKGKMWDISYRPYHSAIVMLYPLVKWILIVPSVINYALYIWNWNATVSIKRLLEALYVIKLSVILYNGSEFISEVKKYMFNILLRIACFNCIKFNLFLIYVVSGTLKWNLKQLLRNY